MAEQSLVPTGGNAFGAANIAAPRPLAAVRNFVRQPAIQAALPMIGIAAALGMSALAYVSLQSPPKTPLFQGLADTDKAAVVDALTASGISYSIDRASGSVEVAEDDVHRARILLAGQGLPKAAPQGDTILAALPMGSSKAIEGETLRSAREADLARTIEAIDVVKVARIHLATPEPSVFVRDEVAPAASVMLTLHEGRTLSQAQVRAIRHLVASSVPGLQPDQVSIVDQSGALLSQDGSTPQSDSFQLQVQVEDRYRQAVTSLLAPVVGRENFTVEVHADINQSESQSTRETYPKDDGALRREEGNKTMSSSSVPAAVGIPGATSNQPPPATQVATQPGGKQTVVPAQKADATGQSAETYARSFDVGREISVTHNPRGQLSRLSVAVALRDAKGAKPRSAADLTAIENLVKGAVGFREDRGDNVTVKSRPFAETNVDAPSLIEKPWFLPLIRQAVAVVVALLVLLFVGRPLIKMLRRKAEQAENRNAEIEAQLLDATRDMPFGALGATRPVTLEMMEAAPSYDERAKLVRTFVKQDPERAALVVRQLMRGAAS